MIAQLRNELALVAKAIHDNNVDKGWRGIDAPARSFGDDIALLHSEVSEALEAYRDFGIAQVYRDSGGEFAEGPVDPDGKLNKPEGVAAELADVLIRLLDTAHEYQLDLGTALEQKLAYNATRTFRHGGKNL